MTEAPVFPPPGFVRRGPPTDVRELDRAPNEKWARVVLVIPQARAEDPGRFDFVEKGPFTLPMAQRDEAVNAGSKDAWTFFTHPPEVFPREASYFNVPGKGCLAARLFVRSEAGVRIYDEVGAGLPGAEFVMDGFAGALGVLRQRAVADPLAVPYVGSLLNFDLDLLEILRLLTLLIKSKSPREVTKDVLARIESSRTVARFLRGTFEPEDLDVVRKIVDGEGKQLLHRFRVTERDFTAVADVTDTRGQQPILALLEEYEDFQRDQGARLEELAQGIHQAEANLEEIKKQVHQIQDMHSQHTKSSGRLTRLFGGRDYKRELQQLKAEAIQNVRQIRDLEAAHHEIPGYDRLQGLTGQVQGFQGTIGSIYRLARDLFDHNVTQGQLNALRTILHDKIEGSEPAAVKAGVKSYDLRLRADVMAKVVTIYSLSAYVLRRPDALRPSDSHRSVRRINRLAGRLIEYFRFVRYGNKTVGDAFDETWGQVLKLEGQL